MNQAAPAALRCQVADITEMSGGKIRNVGTFDWEALGSTSGHSTVQGQQGLHVSEIYKMASVSAAGYGPCDCRQDSWQFEYSNGAS